MGLSNNAVNLHWPTSHTHVESDALLHSTLIYYAVLHTSTHVQCEYENNRLIMYFQPSNNAFKL